MHNYFRRRLTEWQDSEVKKDGVGQRKHERVWQAEREEREAKCKASNEGG